MVLTNRILKARAHHLREQNQLKGACACLQMATRLDPTDVDAHHQLGELYLRLDMPDDAVRSFQAVVGRYIHDGLALKAMSLCKRILQIDPNHRETMTVLAHCYAKRSMDQSTLPPHMCAAITAAPAPAEEVDQTLLGSGLLDDDDLLFDETDGSEEAIDASDLDLSLFDTGAQREADVVVAGYVDDEPSFEIEDESDLVLQSTPQPLPPPVQLDLNNLPVTPLFSELEPEDFLTVFDSLELRNPLPWTRLFTEGEQGDSLYIIVQGRVRLFREDAEGNREIIAHLEAGSFFGEMAVVTGAPRLVSAETVEDTLLLGLRRHALQKLAASKPQIGEVALQYYRERLLANLLAKSPLFRPFSDAEKDVMSRNFANATVDEGTMILREGQPGTGLYVVLRGACDVLQNDGVGVDVKYAELHEGDVFGEIALITQKTAVASVRASRPSHLLKLDASLFQDLVFKNPVVQDVLQAMAAERLSARAAAQGVVGKSSVLLETA